MPQATKGVLQFSNTSSRLGSFGLWLVAVPCDVLAKQRAADLESNSELTVGLRNLFEMKDCFVRARLWHDTAD